jgi:hypothetical protein
MFKESIATAVGLLVLAGTAPALEAVGTIKKVDADKGVLYVHANGQDRTVRIAQDAKVLDKEGKDLEDGLRAKELKEGAEVTITVEPMQGGPVIKAIRLGRHTGPGGPAPTPKESVRLKPLTEMTADDKYKGEDGGLYGHGKNEPPESHQRAAHRESAKITPLDADGKPASDGKIVLVSISMSNATQEFSMFKKIADADRAKSPLVTIVDCAQGGQTMARWADPKIPAWTEAARRLESAKVTPKQVQVAWIKLANAGPRGDLAEHGRRLQKDTVAVLHNLKERFPSLRIAYLGSRIYAGYATTPLNPEPYAYEGAFAARWLILDQIKGEPSLNCDPARGPVNAPLLLWGPYLWGDGMIPRKSDGLVWERKDLAGDGTHPAESGRRKVAQLLLKFFKTDAVARTWFLSDRK